MTLTPSQRAQEAAARKFIARFLLECFDGPNFNSEQAVKLTLAFEAETEKRIVDWLEALAERTPMSRYGDEAIAGAARAIQSHEHRSE